MGTHNYGYDADGKRVWKKVHETGQPLVETVYIYAGPNCIAEYDAGADPATTQPKQEYVYAQGIDSLVMIVRNGGAQKLTVTRNQQWSISALLDGTSVVELYSYDVFGKRSIWEANGTTPRSTSNYNNPYGYTSRRHDTETGLMYFRARYYDAKRLCRFISKDPLGYRDGMNSFSGYLGLTGMDPFGARVVRADESGVPSVPFPNPGLIGPLTPDLWPYAYDHTKSKNKKCVFHISGSDSRPRDAGTTGFDGVYEDLTPDEAPTIPGLILKHGCCEIIFHSHQGGTDNPGGVSYKPPVGGYVPILPSKNGELERQIREALRLNNCFSGCGLFLYACGTWDNPDLPPNRRLLASRIGCNVYGVRQSMMATAWIKNEREFQRRHAEDFPVGKYFPYHIDPKKWGSRCSTPAASDPPICYTWGPAPMFRYPTSNPITPLPAPDTRNPRPIE